MKRRAGRVLWLEWSSSGQGESRDEQHVDSNGCHTAGDHSVARTEVILDRDLAALYGVPTKALKQAVRHNAERFPDDFMFVLVSEEFEEWRSQFVTSKADRMGVRHPPMAFTEQGVAMLSSVLNSERAVRVNIAIMRAFVQLRRVLEGHDELARKLVEMENRYDAQFRAVLTRSGN